ncbi:MAG: MerR family transcriptional regulator [Ornithinimicrobium sp.]
MSRQGIPGNDQGWPIGRVVEVLAAEFNGVSVSKIRFLEAQGLVTPERSESGTRFFLPEDVDRLRFILAAQRDKFWPLRVIREHLDRMDRTGAWPEQDALAQAGMPTTSGMPTATAASSEAPAGAPEQARPIRRRAARVSPADLRESTGLDTATYNALKSFGLLRVDAAGRHSSEDIEVARQAAALSAYGIEARHLRLFRVAADREIGLAEQILEPIRRRRARGGAGADPEEVQADIVAHSLALHTALVRAGLSTSR